MTTKENLLVGLEFSLSSTELTLEGSQTLVNSQVAGSSSLIDEMNGKHFGIWATFKKEGWSGWIDVGVSQFEDKNDNSFFENGDKLTGYYYGGGAGYTIAKVVKIKFLYRRHTISSYKRASDGVSYDLPNDVLGRGAFDIKEYYVGIGIPITIGK